jgi:hypothetical protein
MMCTNNKNTCSGCSNEASWHRRTHLLERDILTQSTPNERLASVLKWLHTPTLLKTIRQGLSYLPTFQSTKRDDHIFGATRYLANTLGIMTCDHNMSDAIDQPMTPTEKKQLWPTATFHCQCGNDKVRYHTLGICTFCCTCSLLIFNIPTSMPNTCPGCTIQCSWKEQGHHVWLASLLPSSTATPSTNATLHNFNNGYTREILMTVLITWNDPPLLDNSITHPLTPTYISYVCTI